MSRSSEIIYPSSGIDPDVLIKVDNVSKKFCRDFKKSLWYGLKDTAADIFRFGAEPDAERNALPLLRPSEFWANQNVSFEVKRGECLGLIGHNGAGKTTLLKMLNGLIKPDTGSIKMRGRIGALIALGAGFNPILTGRENIYVNGLILGFHKEEIDAKLDEIIAFAEVEDAIDAPIRTYSSGMQVRLGFSVAAFMNPDILIIDEVLAVGDMRFRKKCQGFIKRLQANGTAIILVSHGMGQIMMLCENAVVMDHGRPVFYGPSEEAVSVTGRLQEQSTDDASAKVSSFRDKTAAIVIEKLSVNSSAPSALGELPTVTARIHYNARENVDDVMACFRIYKDGIESPLTNARSMTNLSEGFFIPKGSGVITATFDPCPLAQGEYSLKAIVGLKGYPTPLDAVGYDDSPIRFSVPDLMPAAPWATLEGEILHWQAEWQHDPAGLSKI
jgi:ABC-type polysaccharide/polyol phosphate transport system ATPase subunit